MDEKNCNVIIDLLPSYIDGLTSEDTSKFVEEHLKVCDECRNAYENMKIDLAKVYSSRSTKEVDFMKKTNKKLKFLKTFLIFIILAVVICLSAFVYHTARNYFIIKMLIENSVASATITSYTMTTTSSTSYYFNDENNDFIPGMMVNNSVLYVKDGRSFRDSTSVEKTAEGTEISHIKKYGLSNGLSNMYIELNRETEPNKIAFINATDADSKNLYSQINDIKNLSFKDELMVYINIKVTKYYDESGRECYSLSAKDDASSLNYYTYNYDKETGLLLSSNAGNSYETYSYNFDSPIDDSIFDEPDLSEYEVVDTKNNEN